MSDPSVASAAKPPTAAAVTKTAKPKGRRGPKPAITIVASSEESRDPTPPGSFGGPGSKSESNPAFLVPFTPGKYPIVINALTARPVTPEAFLPNPSPIWSAVGACYEVWRHDPRHQTYAAHANMAGINPVNQRQHTVAALLFAASSILRKHEAAECLPTRYGDLRDAGIEVPTSLATALLQLGEMQAAVNGRRYVIPDAARYTEHLIRAAYLLTLNQNAVFGENVICEAWWLPTAAIDPITELYLSIMLSRHVRTIHPELDSFNWVPFTGEAPWWWNNVFPQRLRASLAWLNELAPANVNAWFQARALAPTTRYMSLANIGIPVNNQVPVRFCIPDIQYDIEAGAMVATWKRISRGLRPLLEMTSSSIAENSTGSPAQLGQMETLVDLPESTAIRLELLTSLANMSLFAAFPFPGLFYRRLRGGVFESSSDLLALARVTFVQRDFKVN